MGLRRERLADEIRDIIASCFQGGQMNDPRLEFVTITAVKLSGDLQIATAYFRVIGDKLAAEKAQSGLESAAGFLRHKCAEALDIRRVPTLRFFFDESVERGARIEDLLTKID